MAPSGPVTSLIAFSSLACFGVIRMWDDGPERFPGAAGVNKRIEDAQANLQAFAESIDPAAVEEHCPLPQRRFQDHKFDEVHKIDSMKPSSYDLPGGVFELSCAVFVVICAMALCMKKRCSARKQPVVERAASVPRFSVPSPLQCQRNTGDVDMYVGDGESSAFGRSRNEATSAPCGKEADTMVSPPESPVRRVQKRASEDGKREEDPACHCELEAVEVEAVKHEPVVVPAGKKEEVGEDAKPKCKSCDNTGKDVRGKPCSCEHGQNAPLLTAMDDNLPRPELNEIHMNVDDKLELHRESADNMAGPPVGELPPQLKSDGSVEAKEVMDNRIASLATPSRISGSPTSAQRGAIRTKIPMFPDTLSDEVFVDRPLRPSPALVDVVDTEASGR